MIKKNFRKITILFISAWLISFPACHSGTSVSTTSVNNKNTALKIQSPLPSANETLQKTVESNLFIYLFYTGIKHKNYENLKKVHPGYEILVYTRQLITPLTLPSGVHEPAMREDDVLKTIRFFYGEQADIDMSEVMNSTAVNGFIEYEGGSYYYPEHKLFAYAYLGGGYHDYKPYVLQYSETADKITAQVSFLMFPGVYNSYTGPILDENNNTVGYLPVGAQKDLTLAEVLEMKSNLPIREYVFGKRPNGTFWIISCRLISNGSLNTSLPAQDNG